MYHLTRCCKKDVHVKFEKKLFDNFEEYKGHNNFGSRCTRNLCYSKGEGPKKLMQKNKSIDQNTEYDKYLASKIPKKI